MLALYNFVRFKPVDTYSSIIDLNKKSRFICFKETKDAETYVDYMTNFRVKYGYWLRIDLSDEKREIKSRVSFKKRSHELIKQHLEIETLDDEELHMICSIHNISLLYCHKFEVISEDYMNKYNLLLSAQELDSEPSTYKYIRMLNSKF